MSDEITPRDCITCNKSFVPKDFAPWAKQCYPCFKDSPKPSKSTTDTIRLSDDQVRQIADQVAENIKKSWR